MTKIIDNYGKNAGKIWKILDAHGSLTPNRLKKTTKLNEDDFYVAVGWLAKENKICKTGSKYTLGNTNLETRISKDAGKIWKTLREIGYVDAPYLPKLAGVSNKDTYTALGWLAREGKINVKQIKPKKPQTKYGLK